MNNTTYYLVTQHTHHDGADEPTEEVIGLFSDIEKAEAAAMVMSTAWVGIANDAEIEEVTLDAITTEALDSAIESIASEGLTVTRPFIAALDLLNPDWNKP